MPSIMRRQRARGAAAALLRATSAAVAVGTGRIEGWSQGTPAASTAEALSPAEVFALDLPASVAERIAALAAPGEEVLLFYYSPTCPHCQDAMPGVHQVAAAGVPILGIAIGAATPELIAEFAQTYSAPFETLLDADRSFAMAVGARATPNAYVVRATPGGEKAHEIIEGYSPFTRGMASALLVRRAARQDGNPFARFDGSYQGDLACRICHTQEGLSWATTHHAQAYYTLYSRERAEDLACVGCHVTGLDAPGGFVVGDHRSPLANVGCEACHSAGGPHDGQAVVAASTCEGCHDAEHSVQFSVAKGLPHIDHYIANTLSESELMERVQAISNGTAERPLLAFPEGETVGAAACVSCHKAQHKALRKAPHARAMHTLEGADAERVACVRCHATPARSGPPAETLDGYRVDEGVGCESCHGPGSAHVQQPRKDNIIGLGESCPECVIEAICTSCHTPQWDEHWSLKPALRQIPH